MKEVDKNKNPGLAKLPTEVRNNMGFKKAGGTVKKMKNGGSVNRGDGCAKKGKTKGKIVGVTSTKKMARGGMTKMARGGMTKKMARGGMTKMARGGMTKKKMRG